MALWRFAADVRTTYDKYSDLLIGFTCPALEDSFGSPSKSTQVDTTSGDGYSTGPLALSFTLEGKVVCLVWSKYPDGLKVKSALRLPLESVRDIFLFLTC